MEKFYIFLALSLMFVLQASCRDCTTHSCLRRLYNSRVTWAEYWTRPLGSGWWSSRRKRSFDYHLHHAGVVVTVENGDRWLIHKGSNYGDSSDTVITDAAYMSSRWRLWSRNYSRSVRHCRYTVNMFMQHALVSTPYNLIGANCQTAANGMWALVESCQHRN
ncbi:uncharacterized protein LOC133174365 [Saccostrea echinata]|uniref:uncharacterized protein LOC133174365 n=1 Tax=Saccostrea echinata TaxID=191078 RepID=UPI002A7F74B7|nr:uncharacterized protein LOC133174365 [Saccostrea echinata]